MRTLANSNCLIRTKDILKEFDIEELSYIYHYCYDKLPENVKYYDDFLELEKEFKIVFSKEKLISNLESYVDNKYIKYFKFEDYCNTTNTKYNDKMFFCIKSIIQYIVDKKFVSIASNDNSKAMSIMNRYLNNFKFKYLLVAIEVISGCEDADYKTLYDFIYDMYNEYFNALDLKELYETIDNLSNDINNRDAKLKNKISELSLENATLKSNVKELEKRNKEYSQLSKSITSVDAILKKINVSELQREIKTVKKQVSDTAYLNQIERLNNQIADLRNSYTKKISDMKNEYNQIKEQLERPKTRDEIIEEIELFLKENKDDEVFINYLNDTTNDYLNKECLGDNDSNEEDIDMNYDDTRIGYIDMTNTDTYVCYSDGQRSKIENMPNNVFLVQNQFVLTDKYNNFMFSFAYIYTENNCDTKEMFAKIEDTENNIARIGSKTITYTKNKTTLYICNNQIISIDNNDRLVRAFPRVKINADTIMDSIISKGFDAYYVLRKTSAGYLLRNIITNTETFKTLYTDKIKSDVNEQSFIVVDEDTVVSIFPKGKAYTLSSYYEEYLKYVVVEKIDTINNFDINLGGHIYNNKVLYAKDINTNEILLIKGVMENHEAELEIGDLIVVDEFNNYLYKKSIENYINKDVKVVEKKKVVDNKKATKIKLEDVSTVTVFGNIGERDSYRRAFEKIGFKVNMAYGYEKNINRIIRYCKDSEYVAVIPSFSGHHIEKLIKQERKNGRLMDKVIVYPTSYKTRVVVAEVIKNLLPEHREKVEEYMELQQDNEAFVAVSKS